jgi:hypothetical protein
MLTRTQALEGGANVTCISKVQFTYRLIHPVNHFGPLRYSPIHKKGEVLNPGNYRMIAVSGVMYRIFANVLKDLVTDWMVCEKG